MPIRTISVRNATFQQWETLLTNRKKRNRAARMIVHGVRPIALALASGSKVYAVLVNAERTPSRWAAETISDLRARGAEQFNLSAELLRELAEREDEAPEILVIVAMPEDDPARVPAPPELLAVALDRPTSPGNIGSIVRSTDAFGGHGVFVSGHAADPYDPRAVRASTGSMFTVPTVRVPGPGEVLQWVARRRSEGVPVQIVGTDESGTTDIAHVDLTKPSLIVTGNETTGMSSSWREACDVIARIPIRGQASSLNAANATTVMLYEADRQRGFGQ